MKEDPKAVLDASAIVAVLFAESGHLAVNQVIGAGAVTTPTGLAEALNRAQVRGHRRTGAELSADLAELGLQVEPLVEADAREMAWIMTTARQVLRTDGKSGSISLGDAACLAVASRLGLPAVCSDGTWELLNIGVKVLPFR
jgi:PIN domain nuclease of toxin-antitoxin system